MALVTSWANRGDPILTDKSVEQRTYRVGTPDDFIDYREIIDKATEQWVGFEEAAASAQIDLNQQPSNNKNETYSWAMNEDSRSIGSYTITRQFEKKVTTVVGSTTPPVIGSVSFSVNSTDNTTFPFSLTMSTTVAGAVIRYKIDSYIDATRVTGSWQTSSGTSQTISVNTSNIAAGAVIGGINMHKYVIIEAYAYRVLQTGTYEGPRSERTYGYRAPVLGAVSWSTGSNTNTTFPVNVTLSTTPSDARIAWGSRNLQSNGSFNDSTSSTVDNNTTISVSDRGIYAAGRTYNGVAYHAFNSPYAYAVFTLDGVQYLGAASAREFGRRVPVPFTPVFNPAGEATQYYFGTTLPASISLSKPSSEQLSGEIDYTWYYVQSNGVATVGGSGTATSPSFNVSTYNQSYKVFNVLGYSEVTFGTIIVVARGKVILNNITYIGSNTARYYTRWYARKL